MLIIHKPVRKPVSLNCMNLTRFFYSKKERPDDELCNQLQSAAEVVGALVSRPLLSFQEEALVCLVSDLIGKYSHGNSQFPNSFLLKCINRGMFQIAAAEFYGFCFVNGQIDTRVWNKRRAEHLLFAKGRLLFPS